MREKNRSRKNPSNLHKDINYLTDNELLVQQNQALLQQNIRLQKLLNNYESNYKIANNRILYMKAEIQSLKTGASFFVGQHDFLKLDFYCLWDKYYQLQMQYDYLTVQYKEELKKNQQYDITPSVTTDHSDSFTPGYNSGTLKISKLSDRSSSPKNKVSDGHTSMNERLLRTKQWLQNDNKPKPC